QIVERRKVFAKQGATRFGNDVLLDVYQYLRNLLPDAAHHPPPRGLQLREPRLDHVCLLAALEVFSALPDPFLPFQDQVGELVADFEVQELKDGQAKEQVNFNVLLILRLCQRALQDLGQQLAKRQAVRPLGTAQLDSREISGAGGLPD